MNEWFTTTTIDPMFVICAILSILQSTYDWMGLDPKIISDTVWKQSAANAISALKTNHDFGFKTLDLTIDPKKYKKARSKFESKIEGVFFNASIEVGGFSMILYQLVISVQLVVG